MGTPDGRVEAFLVDLAPMKCKLLPQRQQPNGIAGLGKLCEPVQLEADGEFLAALMPLSALTPLIGQRSEPFRERDILGMGMASASDCVTSGC